MQKTKPTNRASEEAIFSILMLVFAIFEIVLLTVILAQAVTPSRQDPQDPIDSETESESESESDLPPESRPVFSGGLIPSLPTQTAQTATLSSIDSQYAVLVNTETGEIVAGRNFDTVFSPASMTKVMTLIVACENLTEADLDRKLPLTEEIVQYVTSGEYAGTEVALPRTVNGISCIGDTYRIEDLLYGIGVMSAADCTYMVAKEISGSEEAFVALMNQKAADMGLTHTHFDNAVGFDSPTNVTTAREMAVILAYAMQSETIADILKPRSERMPIPAHYIDGLEEKTYKVWFTPSFQSRLEKYPAFSLTTSTVQATKTGYTTESFLALAASSKNDHAQYILILGDADSGASEKITEKFKNTMLDTESILNTYIP